MNSMMELMEKIRILRVQRAFLIMIIISLILSTIIVMIRPTQTKNIMEQNALLKRYALRLEKQNHLKDQAFLKLVQRIQQR